MSSAVGRATRPKLKRSLGLFGLPELETAGR